MTKHKIIKLGTRRYKELYSYRLRTYRETFRGGKYITGIWEIYADNLTNNTFVPKDKPHYKYELVKLNKPEWKEFLVL